MLLLFGGKQLPLPARVRRSLGMTHVYRRRNWKRNLSKHGAIEPLLPARNPKFGMPDVGVLNPIPAFIRPERTMLVSALAHEFQKLAICHVEYVHREFRHEYRMRIEFIVPTERRPLLAKQCTAGRNRHFRF